MIEVVGDGSAVPAGVGPSTEILTDGSPAGRRWRGRLATTVVAVGASLLLVVGIGAYVAYRRLFADPRHPEQFTPASVAAFVELDLDAGFNQQAKLIKLAAKIGQRGGGAATADPQADLGADLPDPAKVLSGVTVSLAVSRLTDGRPGGRLVAEAASADAAAAISALVQDIPDEATATVQGSTVTVATKDYTPGGGRLADDAVFQKIMAGAPAMTELAGYLDLRAALTAEQRQRVPLTAIGLYQGRDGDSEVAVLRAIVG